MRRRGVMLGAALAVALALNAVRGDAPAQEAEPTEVPPPGEATLRSRIAALEEPAERADAVELLHHARRALIEVDRRRARGESAAAERAETIAQSAVRAAERRVEAQRARTDLDAARARLAELEARATAATAALERARAAQAARATEADVAAPPAADPADANAEESE